MRRAPYVHRRPGSDRYQFALPAPPDLAHHFPSQWAARKSLGTSELREANKRACLWAAEWTLKFEQLRRTDNPQQHSTLAVHLDSLPTVALTPDLIAEMTTFHQSRALEGDEAARIAGLIEPRNLAFRKALRSVADSPYVVGPPGRRSSPSAATPCQILRR